MPEQHVAQQKPAACAALPVCLYLNTPALVYVTAQWMSQYKNVTEL